LTIWIFNHHALTPEQAGGTRHFDYAKKLVVMGHRVTIFASSFHYASHEDFKTYPTGKYFLRETYDGVEFVWIKTRPYKGNGIGRVVNMFDYMLKAKRIALHSMATRPDIVIGSSVHLFAVYAGYRCARYYKVPFVMEVRDLWPQTLIDMGMSKWHPFIIVLGWLEKFLYKKANAVITNLPHADRYISQFIPKEKIFWIPNGVDITRNKRIEPYTFDENTFNILYAGAIGQANQLDTLVGAAQRLSNENVTFHIVGDGPRRQELETLVKKKGLSRVFFYGALEKKNAIAMINGADLLFFPLADSPVFRYGIASNKLFDYLASARPILFASNAANNPIEEAGAGISVPAGDIEAVVNAILEIKTMSEDERGHLGVKGLEYVENNYDIGLLAHKLDKLLKAIRYNFANSK
jgi:glycosyltransferase involved in cell wall biosynthesis